MNYTTYNTGNYTYKIVDNQGMIIAIAGSLKEASRTKQDIKPNYPGQCITIIGTAYEQEPGQQISYFGNDKPAA